VQRQYNGLAQPPAEYQSHSGAVSTSSTPAVQYGYTELSGGCCSGRRTTMTYPNGCVLNFNYGSGLDSSISRLTSISDTSGTLESYKYMGLDTAVERDHPQDNVNLTYIAQNGAPNGDAGDKYVGLDRFGRVVDQNWYNATTQTSTDRFQYGYDRDSNVLWRQNAVNTADGELCAYDALNQLTSFQRGTLNGTDTGLVGSASHSQSWSPDALGNFSSVTTDGTTQTRSHNQQNEITSISGAGSVTSDANGNLTADGSGNSYVYDAWNRLVKVSNGSGVLAQYAYDALDRRITETHGGTTTDLYYDDRWQVLEERQGGQVQAQNVWSPAGIDTLVLRDQSSQHNGTLDQRLYALQDANGDVTALLDANGNVLERYLYDPYGAVTALNPDWSVRAGGSAYAATYLWQGKRYDSAVGLYDSRERVVSPALMRPLQADPLGLGPDINPYRWEGDSPAVASDPTGMEAKYEYAGPDVTDWFIEEIRLFRAWAQEEKNKRNKIGGAIEIGGVAKGDYMNWLLFKDVGNRLTDYKARYDKDPKTCPDAQKWPYKSGFSANKAGKYDPRTVTLFGRPVTMNQLGNIMYGIMAVDYDLVVPARRYGQGKFRVEINTRLGHLKQGINDPWTVPGDGPARAAAFELGVEYAQKVKWNETDKEAIRRMLNELAAQSYEAPTTVNEQNRAHIDDNCPGGLKPSSAVYTGPQTDIQNHKAYGIDASGNTKRP
jgi:RHS repeat-associated protein